MTTNILVCDDETTAFQRTKSKLDAKCEVQGLVGSKLREALKTLFEAVRVYLSDEANGQVKDLSAASAAFKDFDVAILDNNLWALNLDGVTLTAESLIGYLRAFTNIPYIISLNKNPDVDFDLRYLIGDYQTHADLALNTDHLSYRVLWQSRLDTRDFRTDVFAPSYWPNINEVSGPRRDLIKTLEGRLDEPVLEVLSFPEQYWELLSRHAKGAISPLATTNQDLSTVNCIRFFKKSCKSLPPREVKILYRRACKGDPYARSSIARSVAADLPYCCSLRSPEVGEMR